MGAKHKLFSVDTNITYCSYPAIIWCHYADDIWLVVQMDEVRPAPDFSAAPLCDFGEPQGPDWFHDASSAAKWSSSYGNCHYSWCSGHL